MTDPSSNAQWAAPLIYKIDTEAEMQDLIRDGSVRHLIDPIDHIADDLFELHHPELMHDAGERSAFVASIVRQGPSFGCWVH
jgi:hypothetical protein